MHCTLILEDRKSLEKIIFHKLGEQNKKFMEAYKPSSPVIANCINRCVINKDLKRGEKGDWSNTGI